MNIADDFAGIAGRMKAAAVPARWHRNGPYAELQRLYRALVAQGDVMVRINAEPDPPGGICPASIDQERRLDEANNRWVVIIDRITAIPAQGVHRSARQGGRHAALPRACSPRGADDMLADIAAGAVGEGEHRLALSLARDLLGHQATVSGVTRGGRGHPVLRD